MNFPDEEKDIQKPSEAEQQWDNPKDPENASDPRDEEQMLRQKKEAELRKANLTDPDNQNH